MDYMRTNELNARPSRFLWVTNGQAHGPLAIFDNPLAADANAVVVPSLGSIVPGWTLLVPRHKAVNLRSLNKSGRQSLLGLRQHVQVQLRAAFSGTIYEFEHGPSKEGGTLGCGVDQAHLHTVPLSFDLVRKVRHLPGTAIDVPPNVEDGWDLIPEAADYIYVRNIDTNAGVILIPSASQSQAVRRVIADQIGSPAAWNYNNVAGLRQAWQTRKAFANASF